MSSMSIDNNIIRALNSASDEIDRYFSIFIFIFGIFGNILNIFVFLHRTLRTNSCALLFLVSSIVNIISIISGLTTRMLSGWTANLTNSIEWLCKIRIFIVLTSRTFVMWTLMLATVDRWLLSSSNVHYRHLCTLKYTRRGMFIILFFSILINIDIIYCYEVDPINTPLKCDSNTELCRFITDFTIAFMIYIIPICLMIIFGLLTIKNIRQIQRIHTQPIVIVTNIGDNKSRVRFTNYRTLRTKKIDRRLLQMHLIQIIILTILNFPIVIQRFYSTLTFYNYKSSLQISIENLLFNIVLLLNYVASASSFYIFTLGGGDTFRNAFWDLMKSIIHYIRCENM
ncbi:unnamed protein product [Adineta steineri]|uniref:G-protein coupled receptors family 1 profile domain-containing protein n=2 Tax=Adineta steineri TaxID=433720 RepID=A0A815QG07_9BILA|nr:unnamed protein product [Adineta steineri]CAF4037189.1 unnamed protein product [Adineta steineri]